MLDHEDLKWIAGTSTNLTSMLHQIARYTDLARRHPENPNYVGLVGERVDLATKTAQALFDRVTSNILENTAARAAHRRKGPTAPFTVLPPPVPIHAAQNPTTTDLTKLMATPQPGNPREARPATTTRTSNEELNVLNVNGPRELILFIEDEQEVAEVAAQMLVEEGYKVILSSDGFEALRIYQQIGKQIGLVILDFFLPVMDGDAVFDELRAMNPEINVVLSSGFAEQQKVSSMLAQGLRGFIPKPYTREKLLSQVRSILDSNHTERS
ncbi:MAG TPA: response regulator [Chthoniobacterales bacterium]|nr:response regulator [Chthoniobacterales bacterium]